MSHHDVVRAWTDPEYRSSLSATVLSALPSHPAGLIELSDDELGRAAGLVNPVYTTAPECSMYTWGPRRCCPR